MIQDQLITYGPLGLWTLTLLAERVYYNQKVNKVIDNNTIAITQVKEVIRKCQK